MSERTMKNLAQSLARVLAMGGIERQFLTSALDDEIKLTGGSVGDILQSLVDSMDSLNNDSLRAAMDEINKQNIRPYVERAIKPPGKKPLMGKVTYGDDGED